MTYRLSTAIKRGRPSTNAANDNGAIAAQKAAFDERANAVRDFRSQGLTFREIADRMAIDARTVRRAITPPSAPRTPLAANDNRVIRKVANNGGCSTTSGMVSVSVARVPTMERQPVQVAA